MLQFTYSMFRLTWFQCINVYLPPLGIFVRMTVLCPYVVWRFFYSYVSLHLSPVSLWDYVRLSLLSLLTSMFSQVLFL